MSKIQKILIIHGDKILCGLFLLYALWGIFSSILQLSTTPEAVVQANDAVSKVEKFKAQAQPIEVKEWVKDNERLNEWNLDGNDEQRSIFYKVEKIDVDIKEREYQKMFKDHIQKGHVLHLLPGADGKKQCIFPGCLHFEAAAPVFVGLCQEFRVEETSVMTILLKWEQPALIKRATISHCLLQKRMPSKGEEWQMVKDEKGEILKIHGAQKNAAVDPEGEKAEEEQAPQGGGFMGLIENVPAQNGAPLDENVSQEPLSFSYYDFNLKAGAEYEYRVKAIGSDIKSREDVEGAWSANLVGVTKEDKGITFSRYIPGLRGKDGKLKTGSDGKIISPDKVYVMISKQYSPPWSPKKYFVYYSFKTEVPSNIGKKDTRYRIKTETGEAVYKDYRHKFMFIGGQKTDESVYTAEDIKNRDKKKWKDYKIEKDFSTNWYCEKVEEVVEVSKIVEQYPGSDGEMRSRTVEKKKYRYFLIVNDIKTKKKEKFELKRDRHDVPLIRR